MGLAIASRFDTDRSHHPHTPTDVPSAPDYNHYNHGVSNRTYGLPWPTPWPTPWGRTWNSNSQSAWPPSTLDIS